VSEESVWCVKNRGTWCATYRGKKPDKKVMRDRTRCDYWVIFRAGAELRSPTCPTCLAKVRRAASRRVVAV